MEDVLAERQSLLIFFPSVRFVQVASSGVSFMACSSEHEMMDEKAMRGKVLSMRFMTK